MSKMNRPFPSDRATFYAVSRVRLDDQRVCEVVWGADRYGGNRWVTDETRAPVADVVGVIFNGDRVLALFRGQES